MRRLLTLFTLLGALTASAQQPWTVQPTVRSGKLRFAVLGDRTGGEHPGVFASAIPAINAQQPDFILSVGDLIDGYTTDTTYLARQWQEFEALREKLQAPYFYVPGNHDISNATLQEAWQRRFGAAHYHFRVGGNLFLVLNTDDGGHAGMTEAQTDYFLRVLETHTDSENLFVVMHRPLWKEPAGSGKMGYERLEKTLAAHHYTLFCGHEHYYVRHTIAGNPHYMLATLGGGSALRGEGLGEFNHFLMVEVEEQRISVRNILADGREIPTDVVTEAEEPIIKSLRDEAWMEILPTHADANHTTALPIRLILRNPSALPMRITGEMPRIDGLHFSPDTIRHQLAPSGCDTLTVTLHGSPEIDLNVLPHISLRLTAACTSTKGTIHAQAQRRWYADYTHAVGYTPLQLNNNTPNYIREDWDWHGPQDGGFRFTLFSDNNHLFIDIEAHDDCPIVDKSSLTAPQDRFIIRLWADNQKRELTLYGDGRLLSDGMRGVITSSEQHPNGFHIRAAIPNYELKGKTTQLNIGFVDQDNTTNTKPSVLWWQPEQAQMGLIYINQ